MMSFNSNIYKGVKTGITMVKKLLQGLALTTLLTANMAATNGQTSKEKDIGKTPSIENKIQNYESIINGIQSKREEFQEEYDSASPDEKKDIISQSKEYLLDKISNSIIPAWKGTTYNFSGNSERPGGEEGIACGHYVTTVLKDAGFNIDSDALGQKRARYIIKTFTEKNETYKDISAEQFSEYLEEKDDGVYILGLDSHTGMIIKDGEKENLCHAAYYSPLEVTCEDASKSTAIKSSSHKEIGNALNDDAVKDWINGKYLAP